ncbi:CU044_2847 family protein [Streptomyces sp. NPDC006703]|uniref:CU044_2847 family protein n=1 Tax=Streptomyces sp. NPDC006703 TaxID=3364759 RepID=UPI00368CED31
MTPLARIPLAGGGSILVEGPGLPVGPVQAGRIGDAVHELPGSLQAALEPVTKAARATLEQLRKARPDEITVEFGVDLAVEAGAVITKSQAMCHLKVTMSWMRTVPEEGGSPPVDVNGAGQ